MPGHHSRRDSRSTSPRRGGERGGRGGSRERSPSPSAKRLHLADLDETVSRRNVENAFSKYGKLSDVWVASYPPYFGFVVFERNDDAVDALKAMKSGYIGDCRIRASVARPRGARPRIYRNDDRGGGEYGSRRSPPRRRDYDRPKRDYSPRRSRSPAPRKRDYSPRRSRSPVPRKREYSPRRSRSPVPRKIDYSPKRSRSPAPRKRQYSNSRSPSPLISRSHRRNSPIADDVSD